MAPQKTKLPVIFGAMTFGKAGVEQTRVHDLKDAGVMLDIFQQHGHSEVDTARVYGGGSSEEYLGALDWQSRGLIMETKLYPSIPRTHRSADLRKYLDESLTALKAEKIHMFYLHAPDRKTPFEETFGTLDELHKEGKFEVLGLSNFMSWEVAFICGLCKEKGWVMPQVYQGVYNAIHRTVDTELFPCLRHYGIKFYAFNPLGGGYLTDRYHREALENAEDGSRFDPKTGQGKQYRRRYFNDSMFDALDILRAAAKKEGLTEAECALRWINHHSKLSTEAGDGVIIGASSVEHLVQNLIDLEKGPLPETVVEALDQAWAKTKGVVIPYYH